MNGDIDISPKRNFRREFSLSTVGSVHSLFTPRSGQKDKPQVLIPRAQHSISSPVQPTEEMWDIGENSDSEEKEEPREGEREKERLRLRAIEQEHVYVMYKKKQAQIAHGHSD